MQILIVDSEDRDVKFLSDCVKKIEPTAQIVSFLSAKDAWAFIQNNRPFDVAFLETALPDGDGLALAKKLQERSPRINIVFCTKNPDFVYQALRMHASGYVMKPFTELEIRQEFDNLLYPIGKDTNITIRTFGDFDIFANGVPITFKRSKSKELLAYLVFKRGGIANKQELSSILFGDEYSHQSQNYFVHIYSDLVKRLQQFGAERILVKGKNQYAIDPGAFSCDLYDFYDNKPQAKLAYKGDFMSQYEWAYLETEE